jgi:hypothetical protein
VDPESARCRTRGAVADSARARELSKHRSGTVKTDAAKWQVLYKGLKSEIPAQEKLSVIFTLQKCDLSGNPIAGESPIELNSSNLNGTNDYKIINTNGVGTTITHSQILKNLAPGSRYKLTYKLILKSYSDIGDIAQFDLLFSSRIKAKLTQENNPSWAEDGTGSDYLTSVVEPSGETINPDDGTSDSLYTEIYFERPDTTSYWSSFSGTLPQFCLNSTSALSDSGNISKFTDGSDWYKYTFSNKTSITDNSYIIIKDGADTNKTSGKLYYFSTQKVFICTN